MSIEVINLTTQLLNTLKGFDNFTDQNDTKIKDNMIKKLSPFVTNLNKYTIDYFLEYMYRIIYTEEYYLFCTKFKIINYFKTIIHNCWYTIKVSTDYNTLSLSFKQKLTSNLPNECSDFIKANCIYSLLLKYYTIWTSYYTLSSTLVNISSTDDTNEETVFLIEKIIKKMCHKNITSNCIFYRIKYILENYKPIYNPEVENYFISIDGHGATNIFNYHYIDPKIDGKVGINYFTFNEILCFAYKDVYNESNSEEEHITDIILFLYYKIYSYISNEKNVYKCFQYYLYSMDIVNTNTNTVVFKDQISNIKYRYLEYLTTNTKKSESKENNLTTNDKQYIINVGYKSDPKRLTYKINIKEQNNDTINSISLKDFSTIFNLNDIQNVYFKRGNVCGSFTDMDIIIDIYSTIFVPIIKDRILNSLKCINICDDIIDYVFKEYL